MLNLQSREHVARRDAVDANAVLRPLDSQAGSQVPDSSLCCIVWGLRLGHVDDGTRHAANHDHAAWGLALHEVLGDSNCVQIGAVDIDAPELLNAVVRVRDCIVVLGESSRGDEIVHLAMSFEDFCERLVDRVRARDIAIVRGDFWQPATDQQALALRLRMLKTYLEPDSFSFLKTSTSPSADLCASSLFMSTIATSAPEETKA